MKALLIGRHTPDFGDAEIDVVEQQNVVFPPVAKQCIPILLGLREDAQKKEAVLLLQNTPAQVSVALSQIVSRYQTDVREAPIGVVISRVGERPPESTFTFQGNIASLSDTIKAIKFANPRAKVEADGAIITVTVAPPMKFVFDHIEWF